MKIAKNLETVRERERESYTLVNKSAVVLDSQKLKNKIINIKTKN